MLKKVDFREYFKASIDLINASDVDYLIIGGIAVGVWGIPRVTDDLDLMIFISKKDVKVILKNAKVLGFKFDEKKLFNRQNL